MGEDRFEDIKFQNPTDWEAFDNLAKDHGIPTLADLKKGENYSAYLIKTDYITEPEPHPYQEILKKENRVAIKEKTFKAEKMEEKELTKEKILKVEKLAEEEITKEKIPKVEKMISNEEMKKKLIAEKFTSTNENITKDKITIGENRNLGIWKRKKGNTESPEQTQNNTENSECKLCNEEFASKGRLGIHEAMCKGKIKTIVTKDSRDIKKTTYTSPTHKEPTKIKNTEENIETKTPEIKIEKNEPMEIKNTKMKVENTINEVPEIKNEKDSKKVKHNEIPKMKKDIKIIKAKDTEQENYKEKDDLDKEEVKPKDQDNEQLKNLQNLMNAKLEREPPEKELYKDKIVGTSVKSAISTNKIFLSIIMLITVASGAQIGTSHEKISIMQINSIDISRKTWISETSQNTKTTLRIIKGPAIISERYVQETQQIIKDIGKPLRIEKNTITKEQENELLSETNTIDPAEIIQAKVSGYTEEEEKMLKKLIADLSIVFWVKEH